MAKRSEFAELELWRSGASNPKSASVGRPATNYRESKRPADQQQGRGGDPQKSCYVFHQTEVWSARLYWQITGPRRLTVKAAATVAKASWRVMRVAERAPGRTKSNWRGASLNTGVEVETSLPGGAIRLPDRAMNKSSGRSFGF